MKRIILLFIVITIASCVSRKPPVVSMFGNVKIDSSIPKDKYVQNLFKGKVIPSEGVVFNDSTPTLKSCAINYAKILLKEHTLGTEKEFYCNANITETDSLLISIAVRYEEFIRGFHIVVKDNKFYTQPFTRVWHLLNYPEPVYLIRDQALTLDKSNYNKGDSLYGEVYFHITQVSGRGNDNYEHYAGGYFRTKVK